MIFGLKNENFFLGSKNLVFNRLDNIPNIFFYDEFRKYFKTICALPIENILSNLEKKYKVELPRVFEGEAIPNPEHNIICYDLNKIRNGVFVFFKTFHAENNELWNDLVNQLNVFSVIKFHILPSIQPAFVLNKNDDVKLQILNNLKFSPLFGENYEGIVIELNGELVKVVDKEKFNKIKQINWAYINLATKYKLQFKTQTKKNISNIKENLESWLTNLDKLETDFKKNGSKTLTIKKKKSDTLKYFKFCREDIIQPLLKRLDSESPTQVYDAFLNKNYSNTIKQTKVKDHTRLFNNTNSCIPKQLIDLNVKQGLNDLGLGNLQYHIVGNNSKNYVGDLDIAISKLDIAKTIESQGDFWEDIEQYLAKTNVKFSIVKGLRQFHTSKPLLNDRNIQLSGMDKNGTKINKLGWVQLDFFVGNPKWMIDILSGSPSDSKYKASYRNVLLRSIISSLCWQNKENFSYGSIEWKDGVKFCTNKIIPPKTTKEYTNKEKRISEKMFIHNGNQLARFLFGRDTTWDQINSFEKLFALYQSPRFRFNKFRHIINQAIVINYNESNMEVPEIINLLFV